MGREKGLPDLRRGQVSLSLSLLLLRPHSQGRQKAVTCRSACARALVLPVGVNLTKNDEARSLSLALSHLSKTLEENLLSADGMP